VIMPPVPVPVIVIVLEFVGMRRAGARRVRVAVIVRMVVAMCPMMVVIVLAHPACPGCSAGTTGHNPSCLATITFMISLVPA